MRQLITITLLSLALAACNQSIEFNTAADQARAQAEAAATQMAAEQEALDAKQAREHQAELNAIAVQDAQLKHDRSLAVEADLRTGLAFLIRWSLFTAAIVAIGGIAIVGRHAVGETQRLITGFTNAAITFADIRSRLIPLNKDTGQFPLFVQLEHTSRHTYALADANGRVLMTLDDRDPGDAQMIAGMIAIRHTGVGTRNTRMAGKHSADSVPLAAAEPPIIIDANAFTAKNDFRDFFSEILHRKAR